MNRVLAIAAMTVRTAVHSRVFIALLFAVIICVAGFPMIVKGDGTVEGEIRLILEYSLGAAFVLLCIVSLWSGSAGVSMEIAGKQVHLIRSKPVTVFQLWIGKWLGIAFVNVVLLGAAAFVTYGSVWYSLNKARHAGADTSRAETEILASQLEVLPDDKPLEEYVSLLWDEHQKSGVITPENSEELLSTLRQEVMRELKNVRFGDTRDFQFVIPAGESSNGPDPVLEFSFMASRDPEHHTHVEWQVERDGSFSTLYSEKIYGAGKYRISLPRELVVNRSILTLRFNFLPEGHEQTLLFPEDDSIRLLFTKGSAVQNFVKGILVLLIKLLFLSALGLTAGCLLSLLVALFVSFGGVAAYQLACFFTGQEQGMSLYGFSDGSHAEGFFERASFYLAMLAGRFAWSFRGVDPLKRLAQGLFISWGEIGWVFVAQLLIAGTFVALIGCWTLSKKELAL
ncbi:MAG: hypothetical protein GX811_12565 [Lentisphaerae bacterium]|nr:hypothetical protein [Lentisphaerota bacterium]